MLRRPETVKRHLNSRLLGYPTLGQKLRPTSYHYPNPLPSINKWWSTEVDTVGRSNTLFRVIYLWGSSVGLRVVCTFR